MPQLFPTDPSLTQPLARQPAAVSFPSSWRFDFEQGEFVTDASGKIPTVTDTDAYLQWAMKALSDVRYQNPAYDRSHGAETAALVRDNLPAGTLESELTRTVTEALMIDPRTKSVGDFSFVRQGSGLYVTCTITTVRDDQVTVKAPIGGGDA